MRNDAWTEARARLALGMITYVLLSSAGCATPTTETKAEGDAGAAERAPRSDAPVVARRAAPAALATTAYDQVSAACRAEPLAAEASSITYVCDCQSGADRNCVAGNDTNAGTAMAPLRTFARAMQIFNAMPAGGAVVLCRGGSFNVASGQAIANYACTARAPCTLRDYVPRWASGDEKDPRLTISGQGNGLQLSDGGLANHDEGYVIRNLELVAGRTVPSFGLFLYNDVDDVDMCNLTVHGFPIGVYLGGSNASDTSAPAGDGKNERITLRGSYLHHNSRAGWLGAGDELLVDANSFDYDGTDATVFLHSIYLDTGGQDVTVTRNVVRHSTMSTSKRVCMGVALVAHGVYTDLLVEGNDIRFDLGQASAGCWGISLDAGNNGEVESFTRAVVRANRVANAGNVGIGLSSCASCVVEANLVMQSQTSFDGYGILVPDRARTGEDPSSTGLLVRSNTVVLAPGARNWIGIGVTTEGTGHVVRNNVVYRTTAGPFACFDYAGLAPSAYDADYDVCFSTATATPVWNASTGQTLAAFQASTNDDLHSRVANPLFAAGPSDVFVAGAGSPLRGTADATNVSPFDIDGNPRGTAPDIGAFQSH